MKGTKISEAEKAKAVRAAIAERNADAVVVTVDVATANPVKAAEAIKLKQPVALPVVKAVNGDVVLHADHAQMRKPLQQDRSLRFQSLEISRLQQLRPHLPLRLKQLLLKPRSEPLSGASRTRGYALFRLRDDV